MVKTKAQFLKELRRRAIQVTPEEVPSNEEYTSIFSLSNLTKSIAPGEPCLFTCEDCDGIYKKWCSVFDSFYNFLKDKPKANMTVYKED